MEKPKSWWPKWVADIIGEQPESIKPLFDWIEGGGMIEAHNAMFERAIWRTICVGQFFWPDIPDNQWMCSAAKAASYSLPRALDKAGAVMRVNVQKDKEGHALMMKMCKPRKITKKNTEEWVQDPGSLRRQGAYCEQDVLAEERFSETLVDLSAEEQEIWIIDQEINENGIPIDLELVDKAIETLALIRSKYEAEIIKITNGRVIKTTDRNGLKAWMADNGFELPNTQAATLDALLEDEFLPDHIQNVVSMFRMASRASTAKYNTIRYRASEDGNCRDILMYAGASRTSRWAGVGIQPQNLPRGKIKDMDATVQNLLSMDLEELEEEYEDLFSVFSGALRGAIIPPPDNKLVCADYSAVEARGLFWVCEHDEGIQMFRDGIDPYLEMAAFINEWDYDEIKRAFDESGKIEYASDRQFGKQTILGAGYGLGPDKFIDYCAQSKIIIDREKSKKGIHGYRKRHYPVPLFWRACEDAAITAMRNPGQIIRVNKHIAYKRANRFLFCQLPGGRLIPYPYPRLEWIKRDWVDVDDITGEITIRRSNKEQITYEETGINRQQIRSQTYGGKLVENIVQALCRDLMAHAMRVVKKDGRFRLLLTVHDELLTSLRKAAVAAMGGDKAASDILCELMCRLPAWGAGFPLAAEGWCGQRYHK